MITQSAADTLRHHVKLTVECIDRLYLNVYIPRLQREAGAVRFFREHRRQPPASSALMNPISRAFVTAVDRSCGFRRERAHHSEMMSPTIPGFIHPGG
jgi:hypothetical protein